MTPIRLQRLLTTFMLLVLAPRAAWADDCSGLTDCWDQILMALMVLAAIVLLIAIGWELIAGTLFVEGGAVLGEGALTAEEVIAEEEVLAESRLQDLVSKANPLSGTQNCTWVAREIDSGLGDMFAGRTPQPYGPPWFEPEMNPAGADLAKYYELEAEYGTVFQESSYEQIEEQVANAGNGARGIVAISNGTTGHVFNVVNYGGKVFFLDGQTATVWSGLPTYASRGVWFLPTAGF